MSQAASTGGAQPGRLWRHASAVSTELDLARRLGRAESGLAVVITARRDGSPRASLVNAGVLTHPRTGLEVVGFVSLRVARKLDDIRRTPRATVVFRSGWEWVAVEGDVELSAPVAASAVGDQAAPLSLVRRIYASAVGGEADEWAHLDEQFAREGHTAVFLHPTRIYPEAALDGGPS